jgi:WXXGXW repeat (2 copies)
MSKSSMVRLMAGLIAVSSVGACMVSPRPRLGVEYVVRRPPVERVEVIPASPGPTYVWVNGYWSWRRDGYEWVGGRWVVPERGYGEWVAGRWEHDPAGWFFVEGHWR